MRRIIKSPFYGINDRKKRQRVGMLVRLKSISELVSGPLLGSNEPTHLILTILIHPVSICLPAGLVLSSNLSRYSDLGFMMTPGFKECRERRQVFELEPIIRVPGGEGNNCVIGGFMKKLGQPYRRSRSHCYVKCPARVLSILISMDQFFIGGYSPFTHVHIPQPIHSSYVLLV